MSRSEIHRDQSVLVLVTERQIYAFDLSHTVRVSIGRHDSNDLQLSSRTVSNFHAEILNEGGKVVLRDLGSTNGTFVNDEKVRLHQLEVGDRIRIGSHVLTMHLEAPVNKKQAMFRLDRAAATFAPGTSGQIISIRAGSEDALKTLQARGPYDLSLADLLKLLSTDGRSVAVALTRLGEQALIFVKKGRILDAEYGATRGEKALYRLFAWREARYQLSDLPDEERHGATIELPADTLILEGMKHASELGKLAASLPPFEAPLRLKEDCPLPLSAHSPAELEIFQMVIRHETIGKVLEASPLTDLRVLKLVEALLRKGVFEVTGSQTLLESTFVPPTRPR
jgi:sulfur carrier protein ThiS